MADEAKLGKRCQPAELDEIVADYFAMLSAELLGQPSLIYGVEIIGPGKSTLPEQEKSCDGRPNCLRSPTRLEERYAKVRGAGGEADAVDSGESVPRRTRADRSGSRAAHKSLV